MPSEFDWDADMAWARTRLQPKCDECHMRSFHLYTCSKAQRVWTQAELAEMRKHRSAPRDEGREA